MRGSVRRVAQRGRPTTYPTASARTSHRSSRLARSRCSVAQRRVQAEHLLVVAGGLRHLPVQLVLPLAQPVELPLDLDQLLACRPGRRRIRGRPGRAARRRVGRGGRHTPIGARPLGERAAQGQVLVDPAGQVPQPPVAQQRNRAVAHPLEEVPVVRDDDQRPRPAVQEVLQRGQRVDVEVVGRLVEQQHVRLGHEQSQQLQSAALATGQLADRRPLRVPHEAEPLAHLGRRDRPAPAEVDDPAHRLHGLEDAQRPGPARRPLARGGPRGRSLLGRPGPRPEPATPTTAGATRSCPTRSPPRSRSGPRARAATSPGRAARGPRPTGSRRAGRRPSCRAASSRSARARRRRAAVAHQR